MMDRTKILFSLTQDADGYPPVAAESVWAWPSQDRHGYVLDNIPFFARQATLGDVVSVRDDQGVLWFEGIVASSENSLVRAVVFDEESAGAVRAALRELGCSTEWDQQHRLIAINVPSTTSLDAVEAYLEAEAGIGRLDYEEPILRQ